MKKFSFNDNWYFTKKMDADIFEEGEKISLPHTWNAKDGQDGGNDYYRGTCCYGKKFNTPRIENGERIFIESEGAAFTTDVFVNGEKAIHHENGYSTFRADITELLHHDGSSNEMIIYADNSANDRIYPQKADFTFYGGLYRDINLLITSDVHFELEKDGTDGIKISAEVNQEKKSAVLNCEAWLAGNHVSGQEVCFAVFAPKGYGRAFWKEQKAADDSINTEGMEKIAEVSAESDENGKAAAVLTLSDIRLWNGVKDPYLYVVKAKLAGNGETAEKRIGLRNIEFSPQDGFFLNGVSYPLRGVSRHQDRAGVGNALTKEMHDEDMDIICEIGANTVRLAHYQQAQYFYDLCDEEGLVVWAEIPYITMHMPKGRENTVLQMRELITQCFHHPSIVCWGLSNEITAAGTVTEDLLENHRILNDLCHKMDPSRPTTMAHVFMLETDSPLIEIADIGSYNLYFGWYLGELKQNDEFFDKYRKEHPNRVIGFSEYGADANPAYQAEQPDRGDYTETYQCIYHEHMIKMIEERPYLWATHVWNLFDFAADGRDEGGKHGVNQKGLVTIDRDLKKDAFYLYKAHWNTKDTFVHLCGSRFEERTGTVTEIKAYSNASSVIFSLNGEELPGQKAAESDSHVFTIKAAVTEHMEITAMVFDREGNEYSDTIEIHKTEKENPAYRMASQQEVVNWFDQEELDPDYFSINDTMGEIMQSPQGAQLISAMIKKAAASRGDVAQSTNGNANMMKMLGRMKVTAILKQAPDALSKEEIQALNRTLQTIHK